MNRKFFHPLFLIILCLFFASSCNEEIKRTKVRNIPEAPYPSPKWLQNDVIYEVNIRQYSKEGTFKRISDDINRLSYMGVTILWLMPIHPIGEKNRKGTLGSYYSVQNYKKVNPNYGSPSDLKNLIDVAHENNIKVIIDWVANHTAWDHEWTKTNPQWYTKDNNGDFVVPVEDWSDVIDLDYSNEKMREAMINAMAFWVSVFKVDGFRCDVAGMVPGDFWKKARVELKKINPDIILLAEAEGSEIHKAGFDISYGWEFFHLITDVAQKKSSLDDIRKYMKKEWDKKEYTNHIYFSSNHDENSWKGDDISLYGDNFLPFTTLAYTMDGIPMMYSGQEAGLNKQLCFF